MLISPAEPHLLRTLGKTSAVPERNGVDFMWGSRMGAVGVQRKEMKDFYASVNDDRLAREFPQMQRLHVAVLLLEGPKDFVEQEYGRTWSRDQYRSYLMSVQRLGIWVVETDHIHDTFDWIPRFEEWTNKKGHHSLMARSKPQGAWGKPESRDWNLFLAQSFPGIGPVQAEKIIEHFGGRLPISWTCDRDELAKVPGIGPGRLKALWDALPDPVNDGTVPSDVDDAVEEGR